MRIARHESASAARGNFVFVGDAGFLAGRDARVVKPVLSVVEQLRALKLPGLHEVTTPGRAIQIFGGLRKKPG